MGNDMNKETMAGDDRVGDYAEVQKVWEVICQSYHMRGEVQ